MAGHSSHDSPERLRMFAIRARHNHDVMFMFLGVILGIVGAVILFHILRTSGRKLVPEHVSSKWTFSTVKFSRMLRKISVQKPPALPTIGHLGIVVIYASLNIILTFAHLSRQSSGILSNLASRTGWMAVANLVVTVCLAIKNTPLAYLAWSYERLNVLHRLAGSATFIFVVLHVSFYCSYFVHDGRPSRLLYTDEIYGMVAGGCFLMLAFSGAVVRAWWYELFYYMHICAWVVGIVAFGLHQPEFSKKIIFITIVVACIWLLDRLIRLVRLAINGVSNEVTLHPLTNGGTRVCVKKAPLGAVSGKHCFLWIPGVRACETHPFTIAALNPLEFVIASYDGFTGDLHRAALANPGAAFKASVDGAYGTFPDVMEHDTTLLIAGGSGASFTFGTALDALKRMRPADHKRIVFVWLVKQHSHFTWFSEHLKTLGADSRVSVRLYVTRPAISESSPVLLASEDEEKKTSVMVRTASDDGEKDLVPSPVSTSSVDSEKGSVSKIEATSAVTSVEPVVIKYERPDVSVIIRDVVAEASANKRVLVMGCGPGGLMKMVRSTAAACITGDGPAVEVHCEEFGW